MADLTYRVSTDQQSTDHQIIVLNEARIKGPVVFEEAAGTFSRLRPLECPKFAELLVYARPGDTVHSATHYERLFGGRQLLLTVTNTVGPVGRERPCARGPRQG